jgi:hypothetical protein
MAAERRTIGVLGAPLLVHPAGAIRSIYRYLSRLSIKKKMVGVPVLSVLTQYGEILYRAAPIRFFKFVWGVLAGIKDPKNEVLENLPRYCS